MMRDIPDRNRDSIIAGLAGLTLVIAVVIVAHLAYQLWMAMPPS
jgi:hypothetical protein